VTVRAEKARGTERAAKAELTKAESAPVKTAAVKPAMATSALARVRAKVGKILKPGKSEQAPASERRKAVPAVNRPKTTPTTRPAAATRRARKPSAPADVPSAAIASDDVAEAVAVSGLTDEEQIESAKYQPRRAPARVFEEERFLFPQSYGVNRLRLLVKDPEWLFAYWDVDPKSLQSLRSELGARAQALSQLTLRVFEDRTGGASTFLLPQDTRTWYVPVRTTGRTYRAEVGIILPSGEFRALARSNSTVTPRVGRSAQKAKKRVRYDRIRPPFAAAAAVGAALAAGEELPGDDESWDVPLDAGAGPEEGQRPSARSRGGSAVERGGASDLHRR